MSQARSCFRVAAAVLTLAGGITFTLISPVSGATVFTRVTDGLNPVVTDVSLGSYMSCAWVDYNGDGALDLFVVSFGGSFLYQGAGDGSFTAVTGTALSTDPGTYLGTGWADYDNDGDLDCWLSGVNGALFRNDGGGVFVKRSTADLGVTNPGGWSGAWADYDQDGYLDIAVTSLPSFGGGPRRNLLLHNDGPPDFTFTNMDTSIVTLTPPKLYTSATWADYDLDGDLDLFVGTGPASTTAGVDYMYRNMLMENGVAGFEQILTSPIATDLADGQHWAWIDIDLDGDLDGFRTNWGGNNLGVRANDLYRNDGGTYVPVTTGLIVTEQAVSLSGMWEDFDNDGDLDCFVTNDFSSPDSYFDNLGDGTFALSNSPDMAVDFKSHHGASAGDMDGDGDLDVFLQGPNAGGRALYRNDLANGNGWLRLDLEGDLSNRSAIGARVEVLATIGGSPVWQQREVNAQNTFIGHSELTLHFGLGDATTVDSIVIHWPRGTRNDTGGVAINQTLHLVEQCPDPDGDGVGCFDNCPAVPNSDQSDVNGNGIGDACECLVVVTGDVNVNGSLTSADIIALVGFIFKGGAVPQPCEAAGDVNCDAAVTAADIIYLVGHVFKGGPVPCDVCTMVPGTWPCTL